MIIRNTRNAALTGAALLAAVVFGGSAMAQPQPSAEAVETALAFGWIDGQLDQFWLVRFTPRGPKSKWSQNRALNRT